jgi:hypothetical protein
MAETAGGLVKRSMQFRPEQLAWLDARARRRGGASSAAVLRELIDTVMDAEAQACCERAS